MATMDIFSQDAFSIIEMSAAIEKAPYQPMLLGKLGIFSPNPIRTRAVMVEEREGTLSVIQTSQVGAPLDQRSTELRKARYFNTSRIAKGDRLRADEIQGIRAFGTESELMQVQTEVMRRIAGPTGLLREVELTHENMRLGAISGVVLDADGSTIYDWFSEFGVTQATEIDFDLDNTNPAEGAVRKKCNQVVRQMSVAAKGVWVPGQTYVVGLCGDNFFDDLTAHGEIRSTYLSQSEAGMLRNDVGTPYETFRYGGIQFINYRGTDDGSSVAVGTDKCKFFPANTPGAFDVSWAPAETFDYVNTLGQPTYAMIIPDKDRNAFVDIETYSYPLFMCKRPAMLQRAKRT